VLLAENEITERPQLLFEICRCLLGFRRFASPGRLEFVQSIAQALDSLFGSVRARLTSTARCSAWAMRAYSASAPWRTTCMRALYIASSDRRSTMSARSAWRSFSRAFRRWRRWTISSYRRAWAGRINFFVPGLDGEAIEWRSEEKVVDGVRCKTGGPEWWRLCGSGGGTSFSGIGGVKTEGG